MEIKTLAMIGCGSMGGGMALLFAENGINVSLQDPSGEAMDAVIEQGKKDGVKGQLTKHSDYASLCKSLDDVKVFVWSLPHGWVGDRVLDGLLPFIKKGDIIIDCANEHWENTERRQGKCVTKGIRYVGCGVSGGYQAARRGPSMCPGGDDESLDLVLPTLRKVAAKDTQGKPCVGKVGTGGAGHFCKMIHNGIEHGMMSAICEAWGIMKNGLGMSLDEISSELRRWDKSGELRGTFLIKIGADICNTVDPKTGERVLDTVEDKVVQDITGEEGTGIWSNVVAVDEHVPAPTLSVAHYLRLASSDLHRRRDIQKIFSGPLNPPQKINISMSDREPYLESLRQATYITCLAAYIQGMTIINKANAEKHFNVDFETLLQVWRAGCIIQADYISEELLRPIYANKKQQKPHASSNPPSDEGVESTHPLYQPTIAAELKKGTPALKATVLSAVAADHVVPALSATLEYLKYSTSTDLPTSFYEAELDYFGKHMFDKKGEDRAGRAVTGRYHYEWKEA